MDSSRPGQSMEVCVLGLGYVGLPTALLVAQRHDVVGVDVDESVVRALENGTVPVEEPGLEALFDAAGDRFEARTDPVAADAFVIATPTPLDRDVGVADLQYVRAATDAVADVLTGGELVVLESTVPPGTSERLVRPTLEAATENVAYAYCPERAIPGDAVREMRENDRVVGTAGGERRVRELYSFVEGTIRRTDPTTAEFVKLIENTHRDVNIALANEFAKLGEANGVPVREAIELANHHPRVEVLSPGPGVGGHCITIDPWFLTGVGGDARLIPAAREVNDRMPDHLYGLVRGALPNGHDAAVAVLGVAYKGNVGDTRQTPARRFVRRARNEGLDVRVHDPHVESFDPAPVDVETALSGADCAVVVTDHDAFRSLDPDRLASLMATPRLVDGRGLLDAEAYRAAGFEVTVLGDGR